MDRYEDAFYAPLVADLSNFGTCEAAGAQRSDQRATAIWKKVLNDFTPPASAAGSKERLASFIERRIAEGGAPSLD
jgi:trimethylamine--corrinoid protein Co-methyltransferase